MTRPPQGPGRKDRSRGSSHGTYVISKFYTNNLFINRPGFTVLVFVSSVIRFQVRDDTFYNC